MEQLQAPPGSDLGQEPATGGFGAGAGPAPTATATEAGPVPGATPRSAGGSGTEAGAEGRTVSKSREPRAESREPRAESREPRAESREPESRRAGEPESRRAGEPESRRAESREPRAESREPRAESREPSSCPSPGRAVPRLNSGSRRRPPESSPAAPSRRGSSRCRFPFRRLGALAGRFRRSLPAAVLLALAALVPLALPGTSAQAQTEVGADWPLKPSGIARGGQFRLLFITSTTRNVTSSNIANYNSFVQDAARSGHSAIRPFASQIRVVGSTSAVDARDNTSTTYTSSEMGPPIYWLNGPKVADDYADFYDESWSNEGSAKDEDGGNAFSHFGRRLGVWTGSNDDGTESVSFTQHQGLGSTRVAFGRVNSTGNPLFSDVSSAPDGRDPFYGLSPVFTVQNAELTGVSIRSTPRDPAGGYALGETIRVRIGYNEPVDVTQANDPPSVWLKVGNEVRRAWYASGSGTANLEFTYTVERGDLDPDGVSLCSDTSLHSNCGRISLNGGTITATADDTAVPVNYPEMGDQAAHKIDGNARVRGVSITSSPADGDTYAAGETVTVRLTFTEAVNVTGRPFVYLNVGGALGKAVYAAGSGSANLDFSYTVQAVDFDANGVSVCSSRLLDPACGRVQLDGGSIVAASDSARSILAYPAQADQSGHKVDGTPVTIDPGLGPISRQGDPAMGIVASDWALLPPGLEVGDMFRLLFVSSTTRDATSTDIADYNSFVQNAAAAGHAAIRGYSSGFRALASTESVDARDNTATTGTGVPIYWLNSSSLADDYSDLYDGSWANESQRTNERGTTTGIGTSVVWSGSTDDGRKSAAIGCSGASTALGANGCNGDGRLGSGVIAPLLNGNPLVGAALSEKSTTLPLYGMSQVLVLQVIRAKASSARIVSRPASGGTYAVGETVAVELGFGEDILVRGTPQLELELDSGKVVARYASGSGTGTLRFEYVVRIGDHTARIEASLDEDGETALRLGGVTITDARGEAIDPGTPALANNAPNQRVEARPPPVTGVAMASSPASGDTYGVGETVTVRLTMREDVTVVLPGRPHVWLEVGGRGAPGRVFRAGGERDARPRILVHGAGGRPRHGRRGGCARATVRASTAGGST